MELKCKLNPEFWNDDNTLKGDVRDVLLLVSNDIKNALEDKLEFIEIPIVKTILSGSLLGENYDATSDVDLHFVVDFKQIEDETERELLKEFLGIYAKNFNANEFKILDHDLEIYFQDLDEPHYSPGIYNLDEDEWDQETDCYKINYTPEEKEKADEFLSRIDKLKERFDSKDITSYEDFLTELNDMMDEIKDYRKKGMESEETLYSPENIVFKMLRRNGALEELGNLIHDTKQEIYSVYRESLQTFKQFFNFKING